MISKFKILCLLLTIMVFVELGVVVLVNTDWFKITRGNQIFGSEICVCDKGNSKGSGPSLKNQIPSIMTQITGNVTEEKYKCRICGNNENKQVGEKTILCPSCVESTHRCKICGELEE